MKFLRIATAVLFAGGLIGASASIASAEDVTPQIIIDCVEGYEAVYSDDGSSGNCVPIATTFDASDDGTCWTNADGVNACARGGVLGSTEDPVPADSCYDATDADGNFIANVCELSAYNTLPADNNGAMNDCSTTDSTVCQDIMPTVSDETLMFKNAAGVGGSSSNDSNTLAALGVLFGALGAFGIGLSNQKTAKK